MFPTDIRVFRILKCSAVRLLISTTVLLWMTTSVVSQEKTVTYYADPSALPPDLPVTIHHLTARIGFEPEQNIVNGSAEFILTRNRPGNDSIIFNTPDFTIASVTVDDQPVGWQQVSGKLRIPVAGLPYNSPVMLRDSLPANKHPRLTITYTARPMAGYIYFIGWRPEESGKRRQIWAHRPHGWLPYMDGRITVDMHVTFDSNYKVFSNGERMSVQSNRDGTKTWHYAMKKDHPFFSTALVIGDYGFKAGKTARGVPLEFWYYSDMPDRVGTTYRYTERMFDFLEAELGFQYPYPLYREAPVIDYMYGAMETTTSTVFGDYMQITPRSWWQRNYVNVNVHELAHQWFGNCITHFVNRDVWLTESFATYYAKMFEKWLYGEDYWQNLRMEEMKLTFEAAAKNPYPVGGSMGGVQRIYQKGSLVLEMLRNIMGDEGFRASVNLYLNRYAFKSAETNDFIRCTYDATGKPWNWFFDQWILRGGEPDYLVTDSVTLDTNGNMSTIFRVRQVQPVNELSGLFRMPVTFEAHYFDGTMDSLTAWIETGDTAIAVPNPQKKEVSYLLFDPGRKLLKKVTFAQPAERMMVQALAAKSLPDRNDALVALRKIPLNKKRNLLKTSFNKESFHLNKAEALMQLEGDTSEMSLAMLRDAIQSPDALVRKAALVAMNPVPGSLRPGVEAMLFDTSFQNVEYALEALCVSFPARTEEYLNLTRDMEGWRGKNIRMKWLEISLAAGRKEYLGEVIGYCSPRYEFETRMNAFALLRRMQYADDETRAFAEKASKHWNNKLAGAAREYLKAFN